MPAEKEPCFMVPKLRPPPRKDGRKPARPITLDDYLALFAGAAPGQRAGEASPQYLRYEQAAAEIAQLQPDARIIAILREPTSFLRSFHGQLLHTRIESQKDFQKAIALEQARRRGRRLPRACRQPEFLFYSDHVRYTEQLRWLHARFPPQRVLVLIYEDYRRDNQAVVRKVLRFLEVDDSVPLAQVETKPLKDVRFATLHRLTAELQTAHKGSRYASPVGRTLNALIPDFLRNDAVRVRWRRLVYRARAAPAEDFLIDLRRRFKPEVEAVSRYLERDLVSLWGYDKL
jgi:hypothetical protein